MHADLPPSSRKTRLTVGAAQAISRRPTAVDPVKLTMSTFGSSARICATALSEVETMFTTPTGISVSSAMILPTAEADHGVSGAGFSTVVQPAPKAALSLAKLTCIGAFHGVIQAATPTGSRVRVRVEGTPRKSV